MDQATDKPMAKLILKIVCILENLLEEYVDVQEMGYMLVENVFNVAISHLQPVSVPGN